MAAGHFAHFGVRFPVFGAVRPCASVRDRLTISVCSKFWHASYLLPFEGHWGLSDPLRGRTPLPVPNSQFLGPRAARFGPRTFILHRFGLIFGGDLIFTVRKLVGGWEASNFAEKPTSFRSKVVQHESGKEKNLRGFTEKGITFSTGGILMQGLRHWKANFWGAILVGGRPLFSL